MKLAPFLFLSCCVHGTTWYAAPSGSAGNSGTDASSPWTLHAALSKTLVKPGDTLCLLPGIYLASTISYAEIAKGAVWIVRFAGSPAERITIRSCGGPAVLDGNLAWARAIGGSSDFPTLFLNGRHTDVLGIEITNTDRTRTIALTDSHNSERRGDSVALAGTGNRIINSILHGGGVGVSVDPACQGCAAYGNIIFDQGWDAPDRAHGDGVYLKGRIGGDPNVAEQNIVFDSFDSGLKVFSGANEMSNIRVIDNAVWHSGWTSKQQYRQSTNAVFGSTSGFLQDFVVRGNVFYSAEESQHYTNVACCNAATAPNMIFSGNVVAGGHAGWRGVTFAEHQRNTYFAIGINSGQYADNTIYPYPASRPRGAIVRISENVFEDGRANVVIVNWDRADHVTVDLGDLGEPGQPFRVFDAQNIFGRAVTQGVYGQPVVIPMNLTATYTAMGPVPQPPVHTDREFGAFLIRGVEQANAPALPRTRRR